MLTAVAVMVLLAAAGPAAALRTGNGVWDWMLPVPQANQLWDLDAPAADIAWAVGAGGTVLRTLDAGATWTSAGPRTRDYCLGVDFADALHGWVCCADGVVWRTVDGGVTWQRTQVGELVDLFAVSFADALHGAAAGEFGFIAVTSDGGATWSTLSRGTTADLYDVRMVSASEGWAVGTGSTVLHTVNAGQEWTVVVPDCVPALAYGSLNAITAGDEDHLWVCGTGGTVLATATGGVDPDGAGPQTAWVWSDPGTTIELSDIVFLADGLTGWSVGEHGYVLHTDDGGATWAGQAAGHPAWIQAVAAWSAQKAVLSGYQGWLGSTADGGETWAEAGDDERGTFKTVDVVDADTVVVAGYAGAMRVTNDAGATWSDISRSSVIGYLNGVDFLDENTGWAVGDDGQIFATTSGGAAWDKQDAGTIAQLEDVAFADVTHGWAVGVNGRITATSDGTTWALQDAGTTAWFQGVDFADALHGWAVAVGGAIFHTDTGGADPDGAGPELGWKPQPGAGYDLNAVCFVDELTGWAVGDVGTILHTTTGGEDPDGDGPLRGWNAQNDIWGPAPDLYDVSFAADGLHGMAVGAGGIALMTSDGGETWTSQSTGCVNWLEGVACTGAGHAWAVGRQGSVLKLGGVDDTVAPVTTHDAPAGWVKATTTVHLAATDADAGVQAILQDDDGGGMDAYDTYRVTADTWSHATDGEHVVSYAAIDNAGNREAVRTFSVKLDTRQPVTRAPEPETVRRGRAVTLKYRVNETGEYGPTARVTIRIKTLSGTTKLKKVFLAPQTVNQTHTWRFTCKLPAKTYRYWVYAVDEAGNPQLSAGSNRLVVR
jgi:photosystem II stability/assembly factor-like uncharacterized protein